MPISQPCTPEKKREEIESLFETLDINMKEVSLGHKIDSTAIFKHKEVGVIFYFLHNSFLLNLYLPVPISGSAGRTMLSMSLSYSHQSQATCQWHPGSKGQGGQHLLW